MNNLLKKGDQKAITEKGIDMVSISRMIDMLLKDPTYIKLKKPAIIHDGIQSYNSEEVEQYASFYDTHKKGKEIIKFVPASGAATRMFKDLIAFYNQMQNAESNIVKPDKSVAIFFERLDEFAFYHDLKLAAEKNGLCIHELRKEKKYKEILKLLLFSKGLNYSEKPKAFITFHAYEEKNRLALEEHLAEAALYAKSSEKQANVHFTISREHEKEFIKLLELLIPAYEDKYKIKYTVNYSFQKSKTDTISIDEHGKLVRDERGDLIFRPGGHGALIENLNDMDADIIFIKNIDNVVPDRLKKTTILYKRALAGILLTLIQERNMIGSGLEQAAINNPVIKEAEIFLNNRFSIIFPNIYHEYDEQQKIDFLLQLMNRPIRICGMVKNESEPGGGPFWVENTEQPLQIVESAQINMDMPAQKQIFLQSTHFNPVDIVCHTKDINNNSLNLLKFIDKNAAIVTTKFKDGKEMRVIELPGLWNGAMAGWLTVFVEVPLSTFNPVKTINDLIRKNHLL